MFKGLYSGCKYTHQIVRLINGSPIVDNIIFDIQPGWKEGTKLSFVNKGDIVFGHTTGDLVVTMKECKNFYYIRVGNELKIIKKIPLNDAVNGIEFYVKCIDGKTYTVPLKNGKILVIVT
jgi:DnaJ family protein B protein 4